MSEDECVLANEHGLGQAIRAVVGEGEIEDAGRQCQSAELGKQLVEVDMVEEWEHVQGLW
jgi:hypothetical protein